MDVPSGTVLLDDRLGEVTVINATDVSTPDVMDALGRQDRGLLDSLAGWVEQTRGPQLRAFQDSAPVQGGWLGGGHRAGNLWHRDRYVTPSKPFDQIRLAQIAVVEDDIVSGVAETTESLAFSSMSFFAADEDEQDVYNQIAGKIDLDSRMREIWRELYTASQVYFATTWERQTFKVRGKTPVGNQRRKEFDVMAPKAVTVLDPVKVVPVGAPYARSFQGEESLAYVATRVEAVAFLSVLNGETDDKIVKNLIVSPYRPDRVESAELQALGVDVTNLFLLDPMKVTRHCLTTSGYRRLSDVRLKGVFELLDMKHQLRQMERAHLIGGTNFIVLIRKGTDQHPALPAEISNLQAQVRTVARVPILVGDHRLSVEIVTPKLDNTLRAERWNAIDSRITARLYNMFMLGNYAAGAAGDDSLKLVKVIARGMESRRHMIRRTLERVIFDPLFEQNDVLSTRPKLQFHPRSIALDFDAAYASFLFDLRQANEISRETILNQFDLDQYLEAENRLREKDTYDDVFQTQVPFSTPNPAVPGQPVDPAQPAKQPPPGRDNGGGRRNGGGAAPGTGQGEPPRRRPARSSPKAAGPRLTISLEDTDGSVDQDDIRRALRALLEGDGDADET